MCGIIGVLYYQGETVVQYHVSQALPYTNHFQVSSKDELPHNTHIYIYLMFDSSKVVRMTLSNEPHLVIHLKQTPSFKCYMIKRRFENKQQKIMCSKGSNYVITNL